MRFSCRHKENIVLLFTVSYDRFIICNNNKYSRFFAPVVLNCILTSYSICFIDSNRYLVYCIDSDMILGQEIPNFSVDTDRGKIDSFHDWIGDGNWAILFSHPADFTPVCTTELARAAQLAPEFEKRNVKLIALSCDSVSSHCNWIDDIVAYAADEQITKDKFPFPIIADPSRSLCESLGMIDPDEIDSKGLPLSARAVLVIGTDKKLKLQILYPATTGRNFDEILRVVDSLILTAKHKVATPVDWIVGGSCMIQPTVSSDEATVLFPSMEKKELPSGKEYLRMTPMPVD